MAPKIQISIAEKKYEMSKLLYKKICGKYDLKKVLGESANSKVI